MLRAPFATCLTALLAGAILSACAHAPGDADRSSPISASLPNGLQSISPPPAPGSLSQRQDEEIFIATRAWTGTPRWALAVNDDDYGTERVLKNFSCAAGFVIDASRTPHLKKLVDDVMALENPTMYGLKRRFKRPRPFVGNHAPTCMLHKEELGPHRSYPSGHTMLGTTVSFVLATLLPERAEALDMRGRIYGESRIVCGAHWASDVSAGYHIAAQQTYLILMRPEIRDQLAAARKDLVALRDKNVKPDPAQCQLELSGNQHSPLRLP